MSINNRVNVPVWDEVCYRALDQVLNQVSSPIYAQVWDQVFFQVRNNVSNRVMDQVINQFADLRIIISIKSEILSTPKGLHEGF